MSRARLLETDASGSVQALARVLDCVPRPTIVLGFVRPYHDLREQLIQAGVEVEGVFFVDATPNPSLEAFRPDAFFIGSPAMLERVGIVCNKVMPRIGGVAHIVVHDYSSIVNYNGSNMGCQFIQQLRSQAHRDGCDLDVLVTDAPPELQAVADETLLLEEITA